MSILRAPMSLFVRRIEVKQLNQNTEEEIMANPKPIMTHPDLKDMLFKTGKTALSDRMRELEEERLNLINDPKLKTYFENIWKELAHKSLTERDDGSILIGRLDAGCSENQYKMVMELFTEACKDARFNIRIRLHNNYYFFEPVNIVKDTLQKISEYDDSRPQLTQGGPYR